jgi:hypothetical protein
VEGGHPQCAVNPRTAFEEEYSAEIPKAETLKRVAVIGAGPAGMTAAETLVARGHTVDLYEKSGSVGGNVDPGSKAKIKYEMKNYLDYLRYTAEKLKESGRFNLYCNCAPTAKELKEKKYDSIVIATGSKQKRPPVEGIDGSNVVFAVDVLQNPELAEKAERIAVIGGGVVGAETAYYLAYEMNKPVTVVEMDKFIMNHTCTANRGHIIHYLEEKGVELLNCTKLVKVETDGVVLSKNYHKNVPDPYNTWAPILPENIINPMEKKVKPQYKELKVKCDLVVLATGVSSDNELYYELLKTHASPEIFNVGDSFKGAKVFEAVRSAYRKARTI